MKSDAKSVLGTELDVCSMQPLTGFLREGACRMPPHDHGQHGICALVTQSFLDFTLSRGNDLTTPNPLTGFPGLKPGDRWCLCIERWIEAYDNGVAPPVILAATHEDVVDRISLTRLKGHAMEGHPVAEGPGQSESPLNESYQQN